MRVEEVVVAARAYKRENSSLVESSVLRSSYRIINCNVAKRNISKIFLFRTLLFTSSWMKPITLTYFYYNKERNLAEKIQVFF